MNSDTYEIEVSRGDLDPKYVRQRVKDWQTRVKDVVKTIKGWAAKRGATIENQSSVEMNEDLMQRYRVQPVSLPTIVVRHRDRIIKIVPKGLWTIGANGRIDLVTTKGLFMLVDFAEPLSDPDWKIYGPDRRQGVPFSESAFFGLV